MKKTKRSLLIGIAAMGLVAASAGAVSTFAWYSVSNVANIKNGTAVTAGLTTDKSDVNVGEFTVTCSLTRAAAEVVESTPKPVVLSVDQATPATYVLLNGNKTAASLPSGAVWAAEYAVSMTITYTGTTSDAAEVKAQFASAISTKDLVITTTATGGLASVVRYVASASNLATLADGNVKTVSNADAKAYTFTGSSGAWTSGAKALGNIYVALTGSEDNQDALLSAAATVLTPAFALSA